MSAVDDPMIGLILLVFALLVCGLIVLGKRARLSVPVPQESRSFGDEPRARTDRRI